jgi:hypothetical protein
VSSVRRPSRAGLWFAAALCAAAPLLAGCRQKPPQAPEAAAAKPAAAQAEGVTLRPEEITRAGIETAPAAAAQHTPESAGYAVVVAREAIAQAVAELSSAAAVEHQSRAALARGRSLAGTPGAMSVESQEAAERQAAVDRAALVLAQRRLSASYGRDAPWKDRDDSPLLSELASGEMRLVRVSFPLGALGTATPAKLRFSHLGAAAAARSLESDSVWSAPADPSIPGRSFFALLKGSEVSEGERLLAHAAVGSAEQGVIVPFAAAVISGGRYWCFVEAQPGSFVRTAIDTSMPTDRGYFVNTGIAPGAQIVTRSAGELLAREMNPSTGATAD